MKKAIVLLATLTAVGLVHARDEVITLPLDEVVRMGVEQGKLDGSVVFHLSGANTPKVVARLGEDVSNKKTNSVGKDTATACKWAALSALMAFQQSAKEKGANAVVDMHSFYKRNAVKDPVTFQCHDGNIVTGVALKGTYANIAK
jgi:uncharacterized protein YbjQ (UPF0145 family)